MSGIFLVLDLLEMRQESVSISEKYKFAAQHVQAPKTSIRYGYMALDLLKALFAKRRYGLA